MTRMQYTCVQVWKKIIPYEEKEVRTEVEADIKFAYIKTEKSMRTDLDVQNDWPRGRAIE